MIFHRQPRKTMDRTTIAAAAASGRRLTSLSVSMKLPSGIFRKASQRKVHPYGFLYGHRHYLVAYNLRYGEKGVRMFSLPNILRVELAD
ncbi:MAG: hypothetical protein QGI11_06450, partial [Nitrospinota bacterium]|nr:hypothetical protein [Nitrospinota bacterium]